MGYKGLLMAGAAGAAGVAGINSAKKSAPYIEGFKPENQIKIGEHMNITDILKVAAEQHPAQFSKLLKLAEELKDSPFLEETLIRQDSMIKSAEEKIAAKTPLLQSGGAGGYLARGALGLAGTAVGGIGLSLLGDLYQDAKGAVTKSRNFNTMIKNNPDLEEYDQEKVKSVFNTLHSFAGSQFTSDPNVSGTFVRNQVQLHQGMPQGVDLGALNQLISARKTHKDSKELTYPRDLPGKSILDTETSLNNLHISDKEQDRYDEKHRWDSLEHSWNVKDREEREKTKGGPDHKLEFESSRASRAKLEEAMAKIKNEEMELRHQDFLNRRNQRTANPSGNSPGQFQNNPRQKSGKNKPRP